MTADALDPQPPLRFLHEHDVVHIIIGGVAVAAHGYPRPTLDLDVVPDPDRANLTRLADVLRALHAVPAEGDTFASAEFPMDACDVDDLAAGGNFRLDTDLGPLDVMQWVAGVEAEDLYAELAARALTFMTRGVSASECEHERDRGLRAELPELPRADADRDSTGAGEAACGGGAEVDANVAVVRESC